MLRWYGHNLVVKFAIIAQFSKFLYAFIFCDPGVLLLKNDLKIIASSFTVENRINNLKIKNQTTNRLQEIGWQQVLRTPIA